MREQRPWIKTVRPKIDMEYILAQPQADDNLATLFRRRCTVKQPTVGHRQRAARRVRFEQNRKKGFALAAGHHLLPHQQQALDWCAQRKARPLAGITGGILCLEMGLGKTLIALMLCHTERPNLVLCNKSLVQTVKDDALKFFGTALTVAVVTTTQKQTFATAHIYLATYDTVLALHKKQFRTLFTTEFRHLVADESQRLTNPKSQLFAAVARIKARYRFCLTGTPLKRSGNDLHAQLQFCGLTGCDRWSKSRYEELGLCDAVFRLSLADSDIQLPEKIPHKVSVVFTPAEREVYDTAHNACLEAMAEVKAKKGPFSSVLVRLLRAREVCVTSSFAPGHLSSKLTAVKNMIDTLGPTDKVLVFSSFPKALELLRGALPVVTMLNGGTTGPQRAKRLAAFRETGRVLLMTNSVGSLGLNLSEANHVVLLEPCWHQGDASQCVARAWRIGQVREVHVWRFIMTDSVEQKMVQETRGLPAGLGDMSDVLQ